MFCFRERKKRRWTDWGLVKKDKQLKTSENYQSQYYPTQRQAFNPRFGEALGFVESVNREYFSMTGFVRSLRLIHSRHFSAQKRPLA
jgi:hypothetical protein